MNINDFVLIGTTLFLGAVALFVPYLAELLKRKLFRPKLVINLKLGPPDCHKTFYSGEIPETMRSVYYFRFEVINNGKSTCKNVENSLENIWHFNSTNIPVKIVDFTPVNLKWSLNFEQQLKNINPDKKHYCNLGYLPTKEFQEKKKLCNPIGNGENGLRLILDLVTLLNVQQNCLLPGSYILQVNTYSENYKTIKTYFKIIWSGNWKDNINEMFEELLIHKTHKPKE